MGTKSKKGSAFEREVCKILSLWWSNQKRSDLFWRTSGSGARSTVRRKQGLQTSDSAADIMATHESSKPFTRSCICELKRGFSNKHKIIKNKKSGKLGIRKTKGGLDFLTILDKLDKSKEPEVLNWWHKAESERIATKRRFTFIIFQRDKKKPCIVMNKNTYDYIAKHNRSYTCKHIGIYFDIKDHMSPLVILKLDNFLDWCEPKCFLHMGRQITRRKLRRRRIKRR